MDTDLSALKVKLDRETVILLLSFMGYEFDRKGMFNLHPKEHTVNAYANRGENNV